MRNLTFHSLSPTDTFMVSTLAFSITVPFSPNQEKQLFFVKLYKYLAFCVLK